MKEKQIPIPGIGQQVMTLGQWKKQNKIKTLKSDCDDLDKPWICWSVIKTPWDFQSKYGCDAFGYGKSEKAAIVAYCDDNDIQIPFWW